MRAQRYARLFFVSAYLLVQYISFLTFTQKLIIAFVHVLRICSTHTPHSQWVGENNKEARHSFIARSFVAAAAAAPSLIIAFAKLYVGSACGEDR